LSPGFGRGFSFQFNTSQIRVIDRDDYPWFMAEEFATCSGMLSHTTLVQRHCKHGELLKTTETVGLNVRSNGRFIQLQALEITKIR